MKSTITLRLDPEVKQQIQDIAEVENRSLSNLIETVLRDYLAQRMQYNIKRDDEI